MSPRAETLSADVDGQRLSFRVDRSDFDQHPVLNASLAKGTHTLRLRVRDEFEISYSNPLPPLASPSIGLREVSESWSATHDALTLELSGAAGGHYELAVWNPLQINSVDGAGAELKNGKLSIYFPSTAVEAYPKAKITLHLKPKKRD